MNEALILLYHSIDPGDMDETDADKLIYSVKLEEFKRQMEYLSESGYGVISLDELVSHIRSGNPLPGKAVVITFDDGNLSDYEYALPELLKHGFPAAFFITVQNIGKTLEWKQIREMSDLGMAIQSHTVTHSFLSDLPPDAIGWELRESKRIIEDAMGKTVSHLALPGGRYNGVVKGIAVECGYKAICTSEIGINTSKTDPYRLKRWIIRRNTDISEFQRILDGDRSTGFRHKTRYILLNSAKKILGNKSYVKLRRKLLVGVKA
ncbi:TPA: polysaccharide deacetylase family protein [Candidatus Poribacteria bacterium]|nr:polysaccharide deacetylase family protein [Candidatus Poribacteria bacterium]